MDYITGQIVNDATLEPLPQASIRVVNQQGVYLGDGIAADNEGKFRLDSSIFEGNLLEISYVGFATAYIAPADFLMYNVFGLQTEADVLDPVIVTPQIIKKNAGVLIGAGIVGLAFLADDKKRRGAVGNPAALLAAGSLFKDPVVKYATLGLGAYLIFQLFGGVNSILEKLGLKESQDTKDLDNTAEDPGSWWSPAFYKNAPNGALLLTVAKADEYAKQIYDAIGVLNDNEEAVKAVFRNLKTQSQGSFLADRFAFKYGADLLSWLRGGTYPQDRLSDADVNEITNYVNNLPNYFVR